MKLLSSSKKFKEKGFTEYIVQNKNSFYRVAYSYVKNEQDALDIVQESIYKGLANIDKLKSVDSIKPWFYKLLINTSIDYIRKNKKYVHLEEDIELEDMVYYDKNTELDVQEALSKLPEEYKSIIILRYFEDMKLNDISDVLDENINTIKTRLYKALKLLKIHIDID